MSGERGWPPALFAAGLFGTPLLVRAGGGLGTASSMLLGYAWLGLVLVAAVRWGRLETGWSRRRPRWGEVGLGILAGALLFVLGGVGYAASEALGLPTGPDGSGVPRGVAGAALLLLAFGVAAVVEEVAFRGVLQRWLVGRMAPAVAVPAQAALFAAWHLQPGQLLSTALYGLVLGALTVHRGGLWPAVVAHLVLNAAGAALFLAGVTG